MNIMRFLLLISFVTSMCQSQDFRINSLRYVTTFDARDSTLDEIIFIFHVENPEEIEFLGLDFGFDDLKYGTCDLFKRSYESKARILDIGRSNNNDGYLIDKLRNKVIDCSNKLIYIPVNLSRAKIREINFYRIFVQYKPGIKPYEPIKTASISLSLINYEGFTCHEPRLW